MQTHQVLAKIKQQKPLVLNITNYVTMDFVANGLLSLGASPVMSLAHQEIYDLVTLAKTVVINIGTLTAEFITLCQEVCKAANQLNKPIIFDPVGAGASAYRTETCLSLLNDFNIAVIRGNAGEIMGLQGATHAIKGVDSNTESQRAIESGVMLSGNFNTVVVISGKTDFIVDHDNIHQCNRGSFMMPSITGTGCLLSAVVAAFHAVDHDRFHAANAATHFYGACGEIAEKKSKGPGSFKQHFLDALSFIPTRGLDEKN